MRRAVLLVAGLLLGGWIGAAAQPLGFAYYDVDRLYDTLPSPFCNDADYTPDGALHWDSQRYQTHIRLTASVIDSLALPLVALFGVENEAVVRDLTAACRHDYSYLHRTLNRIDGLDFALLYYADCFFPQRVETGTNYLYIEGRVAARFGGTEPTLGLLLSHDDEILRVLPRLLRAERPQMKLLVLGRFDPAEVRKAGLFEATARAEQAGRGNRFRRGGWQMRDRIAADTTLRIEACDVYIRRWLIDPQRGVPLPRYRSHSYIGGYGSSLPVFGYLSFP